MVTYQFEVPDDTWQAWKRTVPRDKTLDERLIELIEADTDGDISTDAREATESAAVSEESRRDPQPSDRERRDDTASSGAGSHGPEDWVADNLESVEFPAGRDRDDCISAITAAYTYVHDEGRASMREIVATVMPEHPLNYDVPELDEGDRYRGAWWRRIVKPGLEHLPGVEKPGPGGSNWRYTGPE